MICFIIKLSSIVSSAAAVPGFAEIASPSFSAAVSSFAVSAAATLGRTLLYQQILAVLILLESYHNLAIRLLAFAVGGDVLLILKCRMDNPSLIRIHGLECYRLSGPLYLECDILGKVFFLLSL